MTKPFRGSFAVTITPFTADGSGIDVTAWQRFIDWQLAEGVPGHDHSRAPRASS